MDFEELQVLMVPMAVSRAVSMGELRVLMVVSMEELRVSMAMSVEVSMAVLMMEVFMDSMVVPVEPEVVPTVPQEKLMEPKELEFKDFME